MPRYLALCFTALALLAGCGHPPEQVAYTGDRQAQPSSHSSVVIVTTSSSSTTVTVPAPPPTPRVVARAASAPSPAVFGTGACGGDLPPCSVMMCESGGNIRAENSTSSASGKWQIIDGTWAGFGGYSHASDAPESVQDDRARQLWNGGRGAGNWRQCL